MCLTLKEKYKSKYRARKYGTVPKIADRDIPCWKLIQMNGDPIFMSGVKYEQGFHYYQTGRPFSFNIYRSCGIYFVGVNVGLHSFKSKKDARIYSGSHRIMVEMVIPKGSKYFESDGEYCSDNLIWY